MLRLVSGEIRRRSAGWSDGLALARSPRTMAAFAAWRSARLRWPLVSRLAILHRRYLANRVRVVAVVGSYGKSTTVRAVATALGLPLRADFQNNARSLLAGVILRLDPRDRHAVVEVGIARPGVMVDNARMVQPDIVVVTSIGTEHHRSMGTLEVTRAEKFRMVEALPADGLAVFNGDDPNVRWMAAQTRSAVTFGTSGRQDVWASDIALDWPAGTCFTLHAHGQRRPLRVRLLGRHQVYPVLAAVAVALAEEVPLDLAISRLEGLTPTPGRLEPVHLANGAILLRDDFKSSLETIDVALDLFAEVPAKRRLVVLGEVSEPPGSQGPVYRRLGQRVGKMASAAIFYGGNFQRWATGAARGGLARDSIQDAGSSVAGVVAMLRQQLGPGDVVLIKGRDHERLGRVAIALTGRPVACNIPVCDFLANFSCEQCPMLARGWRKKVAK